MLLLLGTMMPKICGDPPSPLYIPIPIKDAQVGGMRSSHSPEASHRWLRAGRLKAG